jgi:hypothetical protein
MRPSDLEAVRHRTKQLYEVGRGRRALVGALPAMTLVAIAVRSIHEVVDPIVSGALLAVVSILFFWRGQHAGRAVLPGTVAGMFPFAAALAMGWVGETRFMLCAGISFVASVVGGLLLARRAHRSASRARTWMYAGLVAVLTGSVACTCIGLGGLVGLVVGLAAVATPSLLLGAATAR